MRQLFRREGRQLQRRLVDPEKDEVVPRRGFPALGLEEILELFLARPDRGEKGHVRREMEQ